jgi:hypothetical protein
MGHPLTQRYGKRMWQRYDKAIPQNVVFLSIRRLHIAATLLLGEPLFLGEPLAFCRLSLLFVFLHKPCFV